MKTRRTRAARRAAGQGIKRPGPTSGGQAPTATRTGAGAVNTIKHIVVLMLENRSFDHMLGWPGIEGTTVPIDPGDPTVGSAPAFRLTAPASYRTEPDPGHEFEDVTLQLFGRRDPPQGASPTNDGFVLSYSQRLDGRGQPVGPSVGKRILGCLPPEDLPVLRALAEEFVLCDHWFASVPGPTWPNREFVHAGTSMGRVTNPSALEMIWGFTGERTIYENLMEAGKTWKIYYHDFPQAFWFRGLVEYKDTNFGYFDEFEVDVQSGLLPNYSFIEPRYFPTNLEGANDQHPPHDVRRGEELIASIYDALRRNPDVWRQSLFIVTWDEHGGFYDREAPPEAVAPDERRPPQGSFSFDRLGVRVPAVVASPWVGAGVIDSQTYDHTSIPAFLKKQFGLRDFLHERDRMANTFEHLLLTVPREDTPGKVVSLVRREPRTTQRALKVEGERAPSELQSLLLLQAAAIQLPTTQREGAAYAGAQATRLPASRSRRRDTSGRRTARRSPRDKRRR